MNAIRSDALLRLILQRVVPGATMFLLLLPIQLVNCAKHLRAQATEVPQPTVRAQAEGLKKRQYEIGTKVVTDFPDNFQALRLMGYVHSSHGRLDEMIACWQRCRELEPGRADIVDQLARQALKAEEYKEAIELWKQALEIDPNLKDAFRHVGEALLNLGRAEDAKRALRHQIKLSPNSVEANYLLGESYFQLQEFPKAKQSYRNVIRLQRSHSHAYYGLIKCCARLGQGEELVKYSKAFEQLEQAAISADQVVRSEFDDLQQMRSHLANTCVQAAELYRRADPAGARRLWEEAVDADPANANARQALAAYYLKQRNASAALEQYEALVKLEPKKPSHWRQIAFLYGRKGELANAEKAFKKMVEIAPKQAEPYRHLARFYLAANRENRLAEKLAARSLQSQPAAEGYFLLGWAQVKNGKGPQGVASVKKAIALKPDDPAYRQLLNSIEKSRSQK